VSGDWAPQLRDALTRGLVIEEGIEKVVTT